MQKYKKFQENIFSIQYVNSQPFHDFFKTFLFIIFMLATFERLTYWKIQKKWKGKIKWRCITKTWKSSLFPSLAFIFPPPKKAKEPALSVSATVWLTAATNSHPKTHVTFCKSSQNTPFPSFHLLLLLQNQSRKDTLSKPYFMLQTTYIFHNIAVHMTCLHQ
jgi:hypothetical protein